MNCNLCPSLCSSQSILLPAPHTTPLSRFLHFLVFFHCTPKCLIAQLSLDLDLMQRVAGFCSPSITFLRFIHAFTSGWASFISLLCDFFPYILPLTGISVAFPFFAFMKGCFSRVWCRFYRGRSGGTEKLKNSPKTSQPVSGWISIWT